MLRCLSDAYMKTKVIFAQAIRLMLNGNPMNAITKTLSACVFACMAFSACNSSQKTDSKLTVDKPTEAPIKPLVIKTDLSNAKPKVYSYTVTATKGGTIKTADGAYILIEPGIFVDASGNKVTGKVDIAYTPINSVAEIVASGIPMQAVYNGQLQQFVSDGMFEIQASSNGKPVDIADGKSLNIYTESRDTKSEFKYWYFNKTAGNWEETATRDALKDQRDIKLQSELLSLREPKESPFSYAVYVEGDIDFTVADNSDKVIPAAYNTKKSILDIEFDKSKYPELAVYNRLMWQFAEVDGTKDPDKNKWIFEDDWQDVKMEKLSSGNNLFRLTFKVGGKSFETVVQPVVSGRDADKARKLMAEMDLKNQDIKSNAKAETIQRNMYNAFNVRKMGIYNCDRFYNDPKATTYTTTFEYDNTVLPNDKNIYILMNGKKDVISYRSDIYKLTLDPKTVDAIFTVVAAGTLAVVNSESMKEIRTSRGGKLKLFFKDVNVKIKDMNSLNEAISSL